MVRKLTDPGLSEARRRLIENVERTGTHVVKVSSSTPTSTPDWAFTIGLHHNFAHPEVVVFGLKHQTAHLLLNDVRDHIREGQRFEAGTETDLLLNDAIVAFRDVHSKWHDPFLGTMDWFYEEVKVPVVQMVWPDRAGRFPWEPGADPDVADLQPLLYLDDPVAARAAPILAEMNLPPEDG